MKLDKVSEKTSVCLFKKKEMCVCSLTNVCYIISTDSYKATLDGRCYSSSENKATSGAAHYAALIITDSHICPVCISLSFVQTNQEHS